MLHIYNLILCVYFYAPSARWHLCTLLSCRVHCVHFPNTVSTHYCIYYCDLSLFCLSLLINLMIYTLEKIVTKHFYRNILFCCYFVHLLRIFLYCYVGGGQGLSPLSRVMTADGCGARGGILVGGRGVGWSGAKGYTCKSKFQQRIA